jgi:cytochrome c biogenesis protein CcmG, thiol:disulfide interchange protein DsbE
MRGLIPGLALALLLVAAPAQADVLKVGDRLAELDVGVDDAGKGYRLKSLKGKWVLVTVGASWCKPCKKELPTWDKLAGLLKGKITFVAINIDNDIDVGKKFNKQLKLKHMSLVYMPADKSAVAERYGSDTMPTTFVADPNQVVKYIKPTFEVSDPDGETKKLRAALDKLGIK